ncbi:hypothetical protein SESBI_11493 [Sesbania bispinosa]|nr:hypothetical protein SESBI_11493 [Sesbania bispinosa]
MMEEERVVLSQEEADNLHRSTKKQKHVVVAEACGDTFVKETPLYGIQGVSSSNPSSNHELFPTATGMKLNRGVVSYKDICLGSSFSLEGDASEGGSDDDSFSSSDSEEDDSDLREFLAECDPLCPIVKISSKEKKMMSIPWKRSIVVKLLDPVRVNKKEKSKGTVGLHPKSCVSFKGVKEVARKLASTAKDTWPFVCQLDAVHADFQVGLPQLQTIYMLG